MKAWPIYVDLQNRVAYGGGIATPDGNDVNAALAVQYIDRVRAERPLTSGLLIGPGGPSELTAFRGHVDRLTAMTMHAPEYEAMFAQRDGAVVCMGDMHDMPFQAGVFDVVYAANVLEHALAPYCALIEVRRVMVAGGIGYFVMPSFAGKDGGRSPFHLHCLTREVWTELLRKTGLVVADAVVVAGDVDPSCHYTHYRCVAGEPPPPHDSILNEVTTCKASR